MKSSNVRDCIRIGYMVAAVSASTNKESIKKENVIWIVETFLKYNNSQDTKMID